MHHCGPIYAALSQRRNRDLRRYCVPTLTKYSQRTRRSRSRHCRLAMAHRLLLGLLSRIMMALTTTRVDLKANRYLFYQTLILWFGQNIRNRLRPVLRWISLMERLGELAAHRIGRETMGTYASLVTPPLRRSGGKAQLGHEAYVMHAGFCMQKCVERMRTMLFLWPNQNMRIQLKPDKPLSTNYRSLKNNNSFLKRFVLACVPLLTQRIVPRQAQHWRLVLL